MKKILIVGKDSYIGTNFVDYLKAQPDEYSVDILDSFGNAWESFDYSVYDTVYQVAGIAHIKETEENKELYYRINRDLAVNVAKAAKEAGVKQFIYLSSMSVYGVNTGVITKETESNPKSNYGKSKLQAEEKLAELQDKNFAVAILRPPMVYGKNCKGNYRTLEKLALKLPFFPAVKNERSMIYIDNLSEFVKTIIDKNLSGIFFPQNKEYVQTSHLVKLISEENGKRMFFSKLMGLAVVLLRNHISLLSKSFGTLIYKDTEVFDYSYSKVSLEQSVKDMYNKTN